MREIRHPIEDCNYIGKREYRSNPFIKVFRCQRRCTHNLIDDLYSQGQLINQNRPKVIKGSCIITDISEDCFLFSTDLSVNVNLSI